jgi:hypothetical protein
MVDILHRVGLTASPAKVYDALTTPEGLAGWWTKDTNESRDGTLELRFGEVGGFDMKVIDLLPIFLMSLKSFVETGTGAPHPQDTQISNWH